MRESNITYRAILLVLAGAVLAAVAVYVGIRASSSPPPLDEAVELVLRDPPATFSGLIERIKDHYEPIQDERYGEEESWRKPRFVREGEPWSEKQLKAGSLKSGGRAPIHWLRGGSPDKVTRIYVIDISGGGGCWGGGGPRGDYRFFVGANDELFGWYTDGISPLK